MTDKKKDTTKKHHNGLGEPDEETLHTTDPQENMEGPLSSSMQKIKEAADEKEGNEVEDEEEQKKKK